MTITLDMGIELLDGTMFSYLDPEKADIDIEQLATALSNICRFAGHVKWFYSVAQHAVNVSWIVPRQYRYTGLMHDTAEAFTNDLPTPLKVAVPIFKDLEVRIEAAMAAKFGFQYPLPEAVKYADLQMLMIEKEYLKPSSSHWTILDGIQRPNTDFINLEPMSPEEAKWAFLDRYEDLRNEG